MLRLVRSLYRSLSLSPLSPRNLLLPLSTLSRSCVTNKPPDRRTCVYPRISTDITLRVNSSFIYFFLTTLLFFHFYFLYSLYRVTHRQGSDSRFSRFRCPGHIVHEDPITYLTVVRPSPEGPRNRIERRASRTRHSHIDLARIPPRASGR